MHWSYQFILWQISHLSRIFDNHLIHVLKIKKLLQSFKFHTKLYNIYKFQIKNWKSDTSKPLPPLASIDDLNEKKETNSSDHSPSSTILKRASVTLAQVKEKNTTQLEHDDFLSFEEYAKKLKEQKKKDPMTASKAPMTKLKMQRLIPSIMPHTVDIKSDYKVRTEL